MEVYDRQYRELLVSIARARGVRVQRRSAAHGGPFTRPASTHTSPVPAHMRPASSGLVAPPFERHDTETEAPARRISRGLRDILIVEPEPHRLLAAQVAVQSIADVEACSDFHVARARLIARPPDLLVTNLRLERFNGLHLVYVAAGTATRCIVYAAHHDPLLAREAIAAGAFYELADRLPRVLPSYVNAILPARDRRSLSNVARSSVPGGRRCTDI